MNCIAMIFIIIFGLSVNAQADTPQISQISPQETREGIAISIPFTVTADSQIVSVNLASTNQTLIPNEYLQYESEANHYTIVATPQSNQTGTTTILITITDLDAFIKISYFTIQVTDFEDDMYFWKNHQSASRFIEKLFKYPAATAVDPGTGKLFVSDTGNHRVLRFAKDNTTISEAVFGDAESYTMNEPMGLHVDPFGRLWVADMNNNRVLRFDNASTKPTRAPPDGILGKANFSEYSKTSQDAMNSPTDVWLDPAGTLWVADSESNRILRFNNAAQKENHANADAVLGQPDFTSLNNGVTQSKMHTPRSIVVYQGHLFVADFSNNRVLCYKNASSKSFLDPADFVLGQSDFTTFEKNITDSGMDLPSGLAIDAQGRLYVSEQNNNRVLIFDNVINKTNGDPANNVLGQPNFFSNSINYSSYQALFAPYILNYDAFNNHLWVPDLLHYRILRFDLNRKAPPSIGMIDDQTIDENTTSNPFTFTLTDNNDQALTITYVSSNTSLLSSDSFAFSGSQVTSHNNIITVNATSVDTTVNLLLTPMLDQFGSTTVSITATDPHGMQDTQSFTLIVSEINDPPSITNIGNQTINEDAESSPIYFTVTDLEGDRLQIEVLDDHQDLFPSNADNITLSNESGGSGWKLTTDKDSDLLTLLLRPDSNRSGTSNLTVTVSDGKNVVHTNFTITVLPQNDRPAISNIVNQTIDEDTQSQAILFHVFDPDSTDLSIKVVSGNPTLIPSDTQHITLSNASGNNNYTFTTESGFVPLSLYVMPATNLSGTSVITITATDGELSNSLAFTMTVLSVNDPPIISDIENQTTVEETRISGIGFTVNDIDTNILSIEILSNTPDIIPSDPAYITLYNATTGETGYSLLAFPLDHLSVSLMPAHNATGIAEIIVKVTGGTTYATQSFMLNVTPLNDVPVLSTIKNQYTLEDSSLVIPFDVIDPDTDPLTITLTTGNDLLISSDSSHISFQTAHGHFSNTFLTAPGGEPISLTVLPMLNQSGKTTITITAADGLVQVNTSFVMSITPVNDAPGLSIIKNQTVLEDTATNPIAITVSDADFDAFTLSVTSSNELLIPSDTQHITLSNATGDYSYTLATQTGANLHLTLRPSLNIFGSSIISITATDGTLFSSQSFTMTVLPVNDAPIVSPIANITIPEDTVSPEILFSVADPEFDPFTIEIQSKNEDLIANHTQHITLQGQSGGTSYTLASSNGPLTLTLRPNLNQIGSSKIMIHSTDSKDRSIYSFILNVTEINDLPIISWIPDQSTLEDTQSAPILFSITDVDAKQLAISIQSGNEDLLPLTADHITLCNASGGNTYTLLTHKKNDDLLLTVLPASNQTDDISITVLVADEYSIVSQSFTLSITPMNDKPVIEPIADHYENEDTPNIQIPFTAFDLEDPSCSLGLTLISSNQILLANNHMAYSCHDNLYTILAKPSLNQNGHLEISIIMTDLAGEWETSTFALNLTPVNDPPTIHVPEQVRVKMNYFASIQGIHIDDCDAGNNILAITLVTDDGSLLMSKSQGKSISFLGNLDDINTELNTLTYTPPFNALGSREITISVNDMGHSGEGGKQISSKKLLLQIHNDNVKPVNYLPSLTMNEDESCHITPISVFDLDAESNAIEVTLSTKHGYLTFGETDSVTLIAGSFRASTQVTITGSQYEINRALEYLTITCTTHFNGWATLTMTSNDLGHTGESYSPQTAINTVPITVLATIDPPSHHLPELFSVLEDIPTALTSCVIDPDGEDIISVDLEVSTGALQLNSGKGLTGFLATGPFLSFTGKKSDVNLAMAGMIYQPIANESGNYTFSMTYKDMDFEAHRVSIPLQIIAVNDPPDIHIETSALTIVEDSPVSLSLSVSDIEAGENDIQVYLNSSNSQLKIEQTAGLTVYPANISQSLTLTGSIDSINTALNVLNYTPEKNYYGNSFISITVNDLGYTPLPAESVQKSISITITPVNDPPVFMLSPEKISVFEDFSPSRFITLTKSAPAFGEPTQVTYTLTPEPASIKWASITFSPDAGMITITAVKNRYGSAVFSVSADDGAYENNIAWQYFSLSITRVNDPPEFMLSKDKIILNEDFKSVESISLTPGFIPDDEPQTITYALHPASLTWVNLSIDSESGYISITCIPNGHGEQIISVIADDGDITATHFFAITINSINDVPQITSDNNFSISENTAIGTKVHHITAIDVDHPHLIYKIDTIVPDASFNISENTGEIWITKNLDHESIKNYTMTVSVSDALTSVYQTIVAHINDLNDAPILLNVPERTLTTFQEESFVIQGMRVNDIDAGSQPIQMTLIATNGVISITRTSLILESGNYSSTSLSVSGTITAINQALTSVWFNPIIDYKGYASIDIMINDLGHTGPGIAQSDSESISIFILNYNQPPVFTEYVPHAICHEDQSLTQHIVIFDEDAIDEAIQLTLIADNGSLTLTNRDQLNMVHDSKNIQSFIGNIDAMNTALSQIIFIPEKEFSGIAGYTLYANDFGHSGIGGPKNAEPAVVTITCIAVNDPPIHSLPSQVMGLEDSDIPLTLTVSDVDAYTHAIHVELNALQGVISLSNMDGLTVSSNELAVSSLSFTGTIDAINDAMRPLIFHPSPDFYGHAGLTITSNDYGFSVPQSQAEAMTATDFYTITVINVNDAPHFKSSPIQLIDEDSVYSYTIVAGDVDGEMVSLTATELPDWLSFSDYGNNTGIIKGIPRNEHVGTSVPLSIIATDPNQSQSIQSFSIVVNNTNDAPFFQTAPISQATEDNIYYYTVTAGDMDKDASLSIKGNELPDWLYLNDYGNGTALLSGIPANDNVGAINVVILSVSDGISPLIKQAFLIDVKNTNDPPEIISPPVLTATEDALYNYTIAAYDMDGDPVSFTATALPEWLSLANIGGNKALIQGKALNQHVGPSETLIITAYDPFHATASQSFSITVINTNDIPYFSSEPVTLSTEDKLYAYTVIVQDIDMGASIRIWKSILTEWLTCVDNGDGTALISGIPRNEHVGIKNAAVIHASDYSPEGEIEQSFMIEVLNTNDPPAIVSTPVLTATEDTYYAYTIVGEDMDGDSLDFTSDALPQWLSLINNPDNTATLHGMPQNEDVGLSLPLTITAKDPDQVTATQCFSITVYNTNDRPVFISQPIISATEDSLYTYTMTVLDVDTGDSVEINALNIPNWLNFTDYGNGTAIISGIPLNEDVHKDHHVELTANDGTETALSQSFNIRVINTNDPPMITSSAVLTATEDAPYIYTITTDDMDGDHLEFISDLPSWLSLIDHGNNTATLEGIPENLDVGLSTTLTITTMDPSKAGASQSFRIFVTNTNDAPFFTSSPQKSALEDSIYHYTITVADVDRGSSIIINASNLPDWLMIVDHGNGIANLKGTPLNDHVGVSLPLVITASDGIAPEITQTFSITVANTNDIPEITSEAIVSATEDIFYAYTITGLDIDGDPLIFKARMPSWLSLINHGNNTASLMGTPVNSNVGISSPIILTALDPDNATATQTFEISVKNTNDPPVFESIPVTSAIEDSMYTYTIQVQDIDKGAIIHIQAKSIPGWLTLLDNGAGLAQLSGTPKNEHVGDHRVHITATDGITQEISQAFTITVANTNDPPSITTISLPSVDEDSYYNALLTAEDIDGDTVIFTATSLPSWLTLTNHGNNTGSLQGTPKNENIGQTEIFFITVSDPDGATATQSFSFMVHNTNDAPTFLSTPDTSATEDLEYYHIIQVQDIDPDPIINFIVMVMPKFPEWLSFTDNGDGTAIIAGTPLNENVGDNFIGIIAYDGIALPETYVYTLHVENTNDPPEITSNSIQTVDEDSPYHYLITGDDMDGDQIRFIATGLPSWLKLSDNGNNTASLEGVPTNTNVGTTEIMTITALDPSHAIATQSFQITVNNTNDAPWFASQPNTFAIEDITYSHTIRVEDIDSNASLIIQSKVMPSWLKLTDNGNGTAILTGKPLNEHLGSNDVVITVTDEMAPPVSQSFSIWVTNTNDAPVITSQSKQIIYEDSQYIYEIHAEDVDPEDHLQFSAQSLPDWLNLTDKGDNSAVLQGIPQNQDVGETSFLTLTVMDESGESDTQSFTILVINTNDYPEISPIESQSSKEYQITSPFLFTVADMDADELSIQASSSDISIVAIDARHITFCTQNFYGESIHLTSTNAIQPISLTLFPLRDGVAEITVTVADAELSASTSFVLTVTNVNIPPQISQIPNTIINEDAVRFPVNFTVVDSDSDNREITVTAMTDTPALLPADSDHISIVEMGIVHHFVADTPVDLNLFLSPLHNQSGCAGITITVMDADGDSVMQHFQLTVSRLSDDPPKLSHIKNISIVEDTPVYQTGLTVMDPDGGHLTIAVQSSNQQLIPSENIICQSASLSTQAHEFEDLTLTMYPKADENGSVTITIFATDEQDHTTESSFMLTVRSVNDAPIISDIASVKVDEDTLSYPISFTIVDADGDSLSLNVISGNPYLVLQSDIQFQNLIHTKAGDQTIVNAFISTQENASGSAQITFTVTDPAGITLNSSFEIIVNPINDPPCISSIVPQYIYEETISSPIDLTIADQESGTLFIYAETNNNTALPISCLTFAGKTNGSYMADVFSGEPHHLTLLIMPPLDVNGTVIIKLFVYDRNNLYDAIQFPLTVLAVNDMPEFDLKTITLDVNEDAGLQSFNRWITNISAGAYNETDALSFIIQSTNNHLFAIKPQIHIYGTTGTLTFAPTPDDYGTALLSVSLTDGYSTTTEKSFIINILPVNDSPQLSTKITELKTNENQSFTPVPFSISDVDDDKLTISIITDMQFFSEISICSGTDCQYCSEDACEFQYVQQSKRDYLELMLETLKRLTHVTDNWSADIQDIDKNTKISLAEAIYYIKQISTDFVLQVRPQIWQSGNQLLTLMISDKSGNQVSKSVSYSVTPISNPPILTVDDCEGFEDDLIPLSLNLELLDTDSEELLDVLISGVPDDASLNKGIKNSGKWILAPDDLNHLLIAPESNCSDDLFLTVTASSKEKTLSQKASVLKDIFIDIIPVADQPSLELESSAISGQADQDIPIVFKTLKLTDTDGSEQWDRIEIVRFDSDLQFSKGTIINGKLIIDLSHQTDMDLSGFDMSVKSSNVSSSTFVIRAFSKEKENLDMALSDVQVSLSVSNRKATSSSEKGGCFISILGCNSE